MFKHLLIVFLLVGFAGHAQDSLSLDLLAAPVSPAFNLLGVANSDIERPTDLTAFAISIKNSSSNFTRFPSNYALEFAPGWLSRKPNLTMDKFQSTKPGDVFWQSFLVSFGISKQNADGEESDDSTAFTRTGIGIKFSLVRPKWTGKVQRDFEKVKIFQKKVLQHFISKMDSLDENNPQIKELITFRRETERNPALTADEKEKKLIVINDSITVLRQTIIDNLTDEISRNNQDYIELTTTASSFKIERRGFALDFAGGTVIDFAENRFNNSNVSKAGFWLTGGSEGGNTIPSFFGIARLLFQPDKIFADDSGKLGTKDITTFDAGARVIIKGSNGRFNASAEALYRSVLGVVDLDNSWRVVLNADYDIGMNKKLTLSFGRNFDGTISKDGNLVAAINFLAGFGNRRKIK